MNLKQLSTLLRSVQGMDLGKKMTTNELSCFLIVVCGPDSTLGHVAKLAHLDHASVSRVMKSLTKLGRMGYEDGYGFVEVYDDNEDRRVRRVRLTRRGQTFASRLENLGGSKS